MSNTRTKRKITTAATGVVAALALCATAAAAEVPKPDQDPFYDAPSRKQLAKLKRGEIIRSRSVAVSGLGFGGAVDSWQLFYRSNDSKRRPAAVLATLIVPRTPSAGVRPLVSYQAAIDSLGSDCNPGYTLQTGTQREAPLIVQALNRGWATVVPDFEGPRNAYGAGPMAGRAVLDGIRAARRFAPAGLAGPRTPVGLWGYSGGGQATAWAAEMQPGYAPRMKIAGVAAGGVPPYLDQVAHQIDGGLFAGIYFAVSVGLSREFPELRIEDLLNDDGRAMVAEIGEKCVDDLGTDYAGERMSRYTNVPDPLVLPRVRKVIRKNELGKGTPTAPLYIYHSVIDQLIPVAGPDALVAEYCAEGAPVFYERSFLGEHVALVATGALGALDYLSARFGGQVPPTSC